MENHQAEQKSVTDDNDQPKFTVELPHFKYATVYHPETHEIQKIDKSTVRHFNFSSWNLMN